MNKMEMSLDDIIKTSLFGNNNKRRKTRGYRHPGGERKTRESFRIQTSGSGPKGILKHRRESGVIQKKKFTPENAISEKKRISRLIIGNLDYGVTDTDIWELFKGIGRIKGAVVHYDQFGNSLGTAELAFKYRSDALKAMKQFHQVPLDGRLMNIQLVLDAKDVMNFPLNTSNFKTNSFKPRTFKEHIIRNRSLNFNNFKSVTFKPRDSYFRS